jgi:putative toxin-antitoxin system antitoxin component (TIGR02293 family)
MSIVAGGIDRAKGLADTQVVPGGGVLQVREQLADYSRAKALVMKITGAATGDSGAMLASIRKGLPFSALETLEIALGVPRKELAGVLSIPVSTLTRRRREGGLHVDESDRVLRIARLYDLAVAMMQGDEDAASVWLRTPQNSFDSETPLFRAGTELGARQVEDLIGRLCHGVFN